MDNLSHSVVGLAAGELIHRSLTSEADDELQSMRRRLLLVSCWIASNFPDLDLILTRLLPEPLGYLLHHRGHTHTLLYSLPQAFVIWAAIWILWPAARRLLRQSAQARGGMLLSVTVGLSLHMTMDYLNSYGIHPFHPIDARWYFGDMVFILEPVFWIAFGVPLAMMTRVWRKILLLMALMGALLYFTLQGFLLWPSIVVLSMIALLLGVAQHRAGDKGRTGLLLAVFCSVAFIGLQAIVSGQGRQAIAQALHALDAKSKVLDIAMTPFPSNPLCWTFVSVESNEGDDVYRLRRGMTSVLPQALPVAQCPQRFLEPFKQANPQFAIASEKQGSLAELRSLESENCYFAAWMRFARAPHVSNGDASDLRFSSSVRGNFTTMPLADFGKRNCPDHVPDWEYPRADLLSAPGNDPKQDRHAFR